MLTISEAGKYRLKFMPEALEEWNALDGGAKGLLRKTLKLRKQGYRLVYSVEDDVLVLAVGKRENMAAYLSAARRLPSEE
jgi:mRNA interferase RelE/StbE